MSDEVKGLFDQPIESLNPVYRDTRDDIQEPLDLSGFEQQPNPQTQEPVDTVQQPESQTQEPVETVQQPVAQEPAPVIPAEPVLEQKDWKQVLKDNGYDDFAIGVLEYYKSTGDLTPYLQAKTVDYSAMSDEEIQRLDLRSQYADLSDDEFNLLYQKKVIDKYRLDEIYPEDEQRVGRIELKYETKAIRDRLIEDQKKFRAPERQQSTVDQEAIAEQVQKWKSYVDTDPVTQSILSTKRVGIGDGEQSFNFEIENPDTILQSTYDPSSFFNSFQKADGSVDLQKWYKVVAYANNIQAFEKAAIAYGKTLGRQELVTDLKNPPKPQVGQVPGGPTGNAKDDLLLAFVNEGVHRG